MPKIESISLFFFTNNGLVGLGIYYCYFINTKNYRIITLKQSEAMYFLTYLQAPMIMQQIP